MGEASRFETSNGFGQTRGQEEVMSRGDPGEVVGQIESLLGSEEEIRQEVNQKISDQGTPIESNAEIIMAATQTHAHKAAAA